MQLKTIGESLTVLNTIQNILGNTSLGVAEKNALLVNSLKGYSVEAIKATLTQQELTRKQIEAILASKGYQGELLKTTADEWANIASTNTLAASQKKASSSTVEFGNAMKGLGVQLKAVSAAAPLLAAAMEFAAIYGVYKLTDAFKDWADGTTAVEKYRKAFEQSEKTVEDNKSLLSEYQSELNSNKDKLKELQRLYDNKTITDAQKAELENLKYQNALLDEKLEKIQKISDEESKNQAKTAVNQFNAEFGGNADTQYTEFKKSNRNDSGTNETLMLDAMDNNTATNQLLTLKYFTDAYNRSVEDLKNGVENVTQEDVDNYSEALHLASEQFSSVSDALWNDLQTQKSKLDDVRGTEDFDENTYNNIISWEELFKNYVEEYRKAAEKLKQEADSNSLSQMVEFSATFKELNDIYSRLTDNSSLLSSVNEEIALSAE